MLMSVYILVALYSCIFSSRRLKRPGVSHEVRQMFKKKHQWYVTLFIIIWTAELLSNYYALLNPKFKKSGVDDQFTFHEVVEYVSGIAMFATGILLAIIRLYEPFFVFLAKKVISMCFCELLDKDPSGFDD